LKSQIPKLVAPKPSAKADPKVQIPIALAFIAALGLNVFAQGRGAAPGRAGGPPPSARAAAPFDPTGYWVAIISEDWRWRMVTPAKGDVVSIPLNAEGLRVSEAWDPAKDEAAGEQCKAYGAPGLMRGPTRLHITWQDDNTLKIESDYGTQTRLLRFIGAGEASRAGEAGGAKTWQGITTAQWVMAAGGGRGRGGPRHGSIKSITTQLRPGYLRKNGVPYSDRAVFTEYWDLHVETNGDQYLVDTNLVEDPVYLQTPWITALHFKKEKDGSKWDPSTCDARF
jgi:hypothetical protein